MPTAGELEPRGLVNAHLHGNREVVRKVRGEEEVGLLLGERDLACISSAHPVDISPSNFRQPKEAGKLAGF